MARDFFRSELNLDFAAKSASLEGQGIGIGEVRCGSQPEAPRMPTLLKLDPAVRGRGG
jgi:hypothetical protein